MLAIAQDNELDRGATSVAAATERACALTRDVLPVERLLRFVVAPSGEVVADLKRKLPGRGIWITATRTALVEAVQRNVFARGFKRELRVPADLAAQTESAAGARGARCAGDRRQIRQRAHRLFQGRGGAGARANRGADPCERCRRRRQAQAQRRATPRNSGKIARNRAHRGIFRRSIGFGIEPAKCGTCSATCRPGERDFSRSRHAFTALSDRPIACRS